MRAQHKKQVRQKITNSWLIGAIVVVLLIALLLLVPKPAGKAIAVAGNSYDVVQDSGRFAVKVTTREDVVGISFKLSSPQLTCADAVITETLSWPFFTSTCDDTVNPDLYSVGLATVAGETLTDADEVVSLNPAGTTFPEPLELTLSEVNVYAVSSGNDLFAAPAESTGTWNFVSVAAAPAGTPAAAPTPVSAPASGTAGGESSGDGSGGRSSGGGGGGLSCKRKWECGEWSACTNGKEARTCRDVNNCAPTKTVNYKTYPVIMVGPEKPVEMRTCTATAPVQQAPAKVEVLTLEPSPAPVKETKILYQPGEPVVEKRGVNKFIVAIGVLAVLGALAGVLRYHFKKKGVEALSSEQS